MYAYDVENWLKSAVVSGTTYVYAQAAETSRVCDQIIANVFLGVHAHRKAEGLPHVEIRRCDPVGALQLVAWQSSANTPSLVQNLSRFSVGQLVTDGNIFLMVAPGPYDTIVVLQYRHGKPTVAFSDSTHADIQFTSKHGSITVSFKEARESKPAVKTFEVDERELFSP